jgi:hypothetical protein
MDKTNWWKEVNPTCRQSLADIWMVVGLPGHSGFTKADQEAELDQYYGPGNWRFGYYVRGRIVSKMEAIREYEESYRVYLRAHPHIVQFLITHCGNVYDYAVENVYNDNYHQPNTPANHYQDISVRQVISELVDDEQWPDVTDTPAEEVDMLDLYTGKTEHVPRARGFRGDYLFQIREPDTPGFFLNPAAVPVHDPALVTPHPTMHDWFSTQGCQHLSVEAFWQFSKVLEVRYHKFLELGDRRETPPGV